MQKRNTRSRKYLKHSKKKNVSLKTTSQKIEGQSLTLHLAPEKSDTQPNWKRVLTWLDEHILLLLVGFLFAFIPLYPKLPLADLIPGYIVRLRLEDLFVGVTVIIYAIQVLRKKARWKSVVTWLILAYAIGGLLSTLSGVFLTKTIPAQPIHVAKTLLHYFRYLEYFSLFFVAYGSVRRTKDLQIMLVSVIFTVFAITVYGFGQKYMYWPVYSTMNREFSKGLRLYLTEHARVQSTFGGHYDMAAYLVVSLPILLSIFFNAKKVTWKFFSGVSFLVGTWLLILSASRTSFISYLLGISIVLGLMSLKQQKWRRKIWWATSRFSLTYIIIFYMFFKYGDSIYERFLQTLAAYPEISEQYHFWNDKRRHFYRDAIEPVLNGEGTPYGIKLAFNLSFLNVEKPQNAISTEELEKQILVASDERPVATRPADVYVDVPNIVYETTVSGGIATTTATEKPREYSDNALRHGLSTAIRLDTLWPQAIAGFMKNPIFGSGYATLTKSTVDQFTEAESTDNNFLRTLGETGAFGFVTFYGVIVVALYFSMQSYLKTSSRLIQALVIGYIGASLGLLLNALYIDVYASSKVAFTYWIITGMLMGGIFKKDVKVVMK